MGLRWREACWSITENHTGQTLWYPGHGWYPNHFGGLWVVSWTFAESNKIRVWMVGHFHLFCTLCIEPQRKQKRATKAYYTAHPLSKHLPPVSYLTPNRQCLSSRTLLATAEPSSSDHPAKSLPNSPHHISLLAQIHPAALGPNLHTRLT
jgi:hypothetical protein